MIAEVAGRFDVAIVGAGIAGLAHAHEAARHGMKVVVFERDAAATGASIRNFGMILPLGQAPGPMRRRAMASRETWLQLASEAGFWIDPVGSIVLARRQEEMAVLREFAARAPDEGIEGCEVLWPNQAIQRSPAAREGGLLGALHSPHELIVDPREAIRALAAWLARVHGVEFRFGVAVTEIDLPRVRAGGELWEASRAIVCSGSDLKTLYPEAFAAEGFKLCKLQMMRTAPQPEGWRLGPMVATGHSLGHYAGFAECPSLPAMRERHGVERPKFARWGIHVMACQTGKGEVTIGDSHEYGEPVAPFDNPEIDRLILEEIDAAIALPERRIAQRWHGVYAKATRGDIVSIAPAPSVRGIACLGGAGMTLSFGLASETLDEIG